MPLLPKHWQMPILHINSISPVTQPGGIDPGAGELGGLTLTPGVYMATTFKISNVDLTLDAQGDSNAVFVFQTAAALTVGIPGPTGARSIILTNGALARNVYWYVGSAATINGAGGGTMVGTIIAYSAITFSTAGNGNQTVLNGRALSLNASVTMVNTTINATNTWTGLTSANFTTATNWSRGSVPIGIEEVLIPNVSTNQPIISSGISPLHNLTLYNGAALTVTGTLQVAGFINNLGTSLTATSGTIAYNGSLVQTVRPSTFVNNTIQNLTINNTSSGPNSGVNLSGTLNITGVVTPTIGSLTTNGNLILKSAATGTASIAAGTGNYISGNVVVERFIASNNRKKYGLLTSPVNSPTIYNAWQEGGFLLGTGFGTQITNSTGTSPANGFDATSFSGLASIFTYNDDNASGSKWVSLTNTNVNTLNVGKGYLLFVRGDRSIQPASSSVGNTTLRATGTVNVGTYVATGLTTGPNKFSLVANPYPCAIDWLSAGITKTELNASFTIFDPNLEVFITSNGTTLSPSVASQQQPRYIQSGQAFFVQTNPPGAAPGLTITEAAKTTVPTTTSSTTVFGNEDQKQARLNLNVYSANDNAFADGVVALFDKNYKGGIDKEDAGKMDNFNETFALTRNNNNLSIEGRPLFNNGDTLFFSMRNFAKKGYSLVMDGSNFKDVNAMLEDRYTGTKQPLQLNASNTYGFVVNNDAASASNNRFMITFGSTATNSAEGLIDNIPTLFVKLSPNPVLNQLQVNFKTAIAENTVIKVLNSLGQTVRKVDAGKVNAGNINISTASLSNGLYTVQLISGGKKVASQKMVKQ